MDFGSDTEDDEENLQCEMDSDEEERQENEALLKMMTVPYTKTKQCRDVDEFEAEMEAELDKRALDVEALGGVAHQKSMSRSSSTSSLNKVSQSSVPSTPKLSKVSREGKPKKSVRFSGGGPLVAEIPSTSEQSGPAGETTSSVVEEAKGAKEEFYDPIYFDSDESEGEDDTKRTAKQKKRTLVSDDELLYDPESDARDQAWVDNRRRKYRPTQTKEPAGSSSSQPRSSTSDAILNCPACFSTLCLDCQRHELYTTQYRAMFVMNCVIDKSETLRVPLKEEKKTRKNRNRQPDNSEPHNPKNDLFNPVKCKICTTQVAVYDSEEVYHFFNVLASYA